MGSIPTTPTTFMNIHPLCYCDMNEQELQSFMEKSLVDKQEFDLLKEEYLKLYHICAGIYYARIGLDSDRVISGLNEIDNYFREENFN